MKKIYITQDDYKILSNIFHALPFEILVFGSRIKGTQQKFSDLDLCLKDKNPIELGDIATLKEKLSDSDLPFTVDIIDYHDISDSFKKIIDKEAVNFFDTVYAI